ncbi:MAG: ClpX C4-type zinc finger protein [Deltaproteobacteria bacterium]|nr:ClpX C4-type zinc finger protein [Deltaproteobacteria bacterium]
MPKRPTCQPDAHRVIDFPQRSRAARPVASQATSAGSGVQERWEPEPVSAVDLFDRWAKLGKESPFHAGDERVRVAGTVERVFLGHDDVARVVLRADSQGLRTVECRCLSDEVLTRARRGSAVTLDGSCFGLEDSLTLIVERCELVDARPQTGAASVPEGSEKNAARCSLCGRGRGEARRLVAFPTVSVCAECGAALCRALAEEVPGGS